MAKILCAISGIEFTCEHVPMALHSREAKHPIFYLPTKKLYALYAKWSQGELTDTDSYLLFCALYNITDLVEFTSPFERSALSKSIVANNLPKLVEVINRIDAVNHHLHEQVFARMHVSHETKDMASCALWIEIWNKNYVDYISGYKNELLRTRVRQREDVLQKLIKKADKEPNKYARVLAKWAADAAKFPEFEVENVFTNTKTTLSAYWQQIIEMCCKEDRIYLIPKADFDELMEHCEANIEPGTIYSYTLSELLKTGLYKKKNYLGLGEIDLVGTPFRILNASDNIQDANMLAMIDSAPKSLPLRANYESNIAYLRASLAYKQAQKYYAANPLVAAEKNGDYTNV